MTNSQRALIKQKKRVTKQLVKRSHIAILEYLRIEYIEPFNESLILAQDERWRRA